MTTTISIENLKNHPRNIRKTYGDLKELTASIRENGVLQNLVVVPDPKNGGKYLVVSGNCRLRAAKKAGLTELECVIAEMSEQEEHRKARPGHRQRKDRRGPADHHIRP